MRSSSLEGKLGNTNETWGEGKSEQEPCLHTEQGIKGRGEATVGLAVPPMNSVQSKAKKSRDKTDPRRGAVPCDGSAILVVPPS